MTEARPDAGGARARIARSRKSIPLDSERLVEFTPLVSERPLPLVARPLVSELSLPEWLARHREVCAQHLLHHGALLFRDFCAPAIEEFERLLQTFSGELLHYTYGSTPRQLVSGRVYSSTEYPPALSIPLHNEMSYANTWPMKIGFLCVTAPRDGGETPVADSRRVYERIPATIRERFARRRVMYVRNYGPGLDVSWQSTFQTDDRAAVVAYCRASGIELEWTAGDGLRTRQICQGVAEHPQSGESVWFNQAHLFHVSALDASTRALLADNVDPESLPRNAYYGDGGAIDDADLDAIRQAYAEEAVTFAWQRGDVLLLDNMLAAHGRRPFSGARRIVVGMNEPGRERAG